MAKRKVTLRVASDELAVVWPVENWRHMIMVYRTQAEDALTSEDAGWWTQAADYIQGCIEKSDVATHEWE